MISHKFTVLVLCTLVLPLLGCFESSAELNQEGAKMVNLRRDYKAGAELFRQALAKDPANAKAHKNLAYCLLKEKQTEQAKTHLQKAVELDPSYGAAHINLSILYLLEKDYEKAVEHMDHAVEAGFPVDTAYRKKLQKHR